MTTDDNDSDRDATGPICSQCGRPLERREPQFGVPYWACSKAHEPPEVAPIAKDIDYATALIRSRILDTFDQGEVSHFDADAHCDPGRFVAALCERLETCWESDRQRERERYDEQDRSGSGHSPEQPQSQGQSQQDRLDSFA